MKLMKGNMSKIISMNLNSVQKMKKIQHLLNFNISSNNRVSDMIRMNSKLIIGNTKFCFSETPKENENNFYTKIDKDSAPAEISFFKKTLKRFKAFFLKRIVAFRIMFYTSFILIIFSVMRYSNTSTFSKNVTPSFFLNNLVDEHTFYKVAGIVKPNSICYIKGTDEVSFYLTDYDHDMCVLYKGNLSGSFSEGSTAVCTGCVNNPKNPNTLSATHILTDHSYNSDTWLSNLF